MFRFDNRIIYVFLAIFVIRHIMLNLTDTNFILSLLYSLPAMLIAITFHEFAHAWTADKLGDETPRMQGRLTLNPVAHLDPVGSVLLVFAGFGWGKPVEVNPRNYSTKMSMSKADAIVSFAGPAMNFILAIVFMIIWYAIRVFAPLFAVTQIGNIILDLIAVTVTINMGLAVFNLIPLPPLDGSKVLNHFLPYNARQWFAEKEYAFYIVFLLIWMTGIAGYIITPIIQWLTMGLNYVIGLLFSFMI